MLHQNKPQQIRGSHVPRCWIAPFCQMPHLCLSFGRTGHQEINQPSLKTYRTQQKRCQITGLLTSDCSSLR